MPTLCQGSIVWARVIDPQGRNLKARPLVILTGDADLAGNETLVAIAASHSATLVRNPPEGALMLPYHPQGRVRTGLRKPTVAIPNWLVEIRKADIESIAGIVPPQILAQIVAKAKSAKLPPPETEE